MSWPAACRHGVPVGCEDSQQAESEGVEYPELQHAGCSADGAT